MVIAIEILFVLLVVWVDYCKANRRILAFLPSFLPFPTGSPLNLRVWGLGFEGSGFQGFPSSDLEYFRVNNKTQDFPGSNPDLDPHLPPRTFRMV